MNALHVGRFAKLAGLALLIGLSIAPADAAVDQEAVRSACTSDAFRLCSNTMPDVGRTKACLMSHRGSLSPTCRAGMSGGGGHHRSHHHHH